MSYTVATGTWGAVQKLYNAEQEMAYDYEDGELYATKYNITESDVNIVVHEKQFIVAWNRARILVSTFCFVLFVIFRFGDKTQLHKIWSPTSNPTPDYVLDFEANVQASWVKLITSKFFYFLFFYYFKKQNLIYY
jgi:hypothetical protein